MRSITFAAGSRVTGCPTSIEKIEAAYDAEGVCFHGNRMQGRRVRFSTVTGLVTELLECREDRTLGRWHKQLERQDLLVLDELGCVSFSKTGAELLFEAVGRAYEHHSLIVTTNLPFENRTEVLGSERLTGALLDRLTHRVHSIEANGESYRVRQAKKRAKRRSQKR